MVCFPAFAAQPVEGVAYGRYFNPAFSAWERRIITVFYDADGITTVKGGQGREAARARLRADERREVISLLNKGLALTEKAHRQGLDLVQELGYFLKGDDFEKHGLTLMFYSTEHGRRCNVILYLRDFANRLNLMELYMEPEEVEKLVALLTAVP